MDEHRQIRDLIVQHVRSYPESLIVIEEYDKMTCETQAMLRQLLQHPEVRHSFHLMLIVTTAQQAANISLSKSIIVFEANRGMFPIQKLLQSTGRREDVSIYEIGRASCRERV